MTKPPDYQMILNAGDGPDGISFYLSDEQAMSDMASPPALYVTLSVMGCHITMGPFMSGVRDQVMAQLGLAPISKPEDDDSMTFDWDAIKSDKYETQSMDEEARENG